MRDLKLKLYERDRMYEAIIIEILLDKSFYLSKNNEIMMIRNRTTTEWHKRKQYHEL